jgi:hypothetical protein
MTDFDSPWKEALERYFPEFLAFFFPAAHADIDWRRGYEFLDKSCSRSPATPSSAGGSWTSSHGSGGTMAKRTWC